MRVSVIICTYNRADGLRQTLECLRQQRHRDFEVVVVNGPSTDHTLDVLADYGDSVRVVDNPLANLSVSRNLGIRAAAGELVAFIDDDALPEPGWLEQIVPAFSESEVAGVGGIVIDHTGMAPQYLYSASTRFGEPVFARDAPYDDHCVPGADTFPYLQGTNAVFRRSALARIGLFDETFDFYLDETDVCCRLVDAGYILRQLATAAVHHKYLPSARRNAAKVTTNWTSIVRNHVYFGYRHAQLTANEFDIISHAKMFVDGCINDALHHEQLGNAPPGHAHRSIAACSAAAAEGIRLGRLAPTDPLPAVELDPPAFRPYPSNPSEERLRIVLVSSGYRPHLSGGIARFISDVAPELARLGHEVRVFAQTADTSTVDLEDGVWVHRLLPVPTPGRVPEAAAQVDGFASVVGNELERIEPWWRPDVMYGSLWDVEMLGVARTHPDLPIVPILATPVAEVAEHEGWTDPSHPAHIDARTLVALEREMVARSARVHAISEAIVETFERLYPGALHPQRVTVAPIGRADELDGRTTELPRDPMVLFIGRLEPRKGIDTFLDAAAMLLPEHLDLTIVVAGDDSRPDPAGVPYPARWRTRAAPGGDRLSFVGRVADETLDELIERATVVVMPSRYESFGLVAVEASMHARPVVASRVGGLCEVVEDGATGLLVDVGDGAGLAAAIGTLLTDRGLAAEMGRRARVAFETRLDATGAARRLADLLRPVARRRAPELSRTARSW